MLATFSKRSCFASCEGLRVHPRQRRLEQRKETKDRRQGPQEGWKEAVQPQTRTGRSAGGELEQAEFHSFEYVVRTQDPENKHTTVGKYQLENAKNISVPTTTRTRKSIKSQHFAGYILQRFRHSLLSGLCPERCRRCLWRRVIAPVRLSLLDGQGRFKASADCVVLRGKYCNICVGR